MGQTLTHGVYLPDEGERNCYSGLAANWQILDNSVGTIAANTAALAGKAPLVHTHTKSDVTDLLNSNFIPSANNTYDLGSSSYQWNNLYAKNYYYNGTAWGLDKVNTWSDTQTFLTNPTIKNNGLEKGVSPTANSEKTVVFTDKNDNQISSLYARMNTNGESYVALRAENFYKNGAMDSTGDLVYSVVFIGMDSQGNPYCVPRADLYPDNTNRFNLGTSSKKWKTLNGVNPGALSLPSDIGYDPIDTRNWDLTGNTSNPNFYTPTVDGWLCVIALAGTMTDAWLDIWVNSLWGQSVLQSQSGELFCMIPVRANLTVRIRVKASSIYDARLFVASGNV